MQCRYCGAVNPKGVARCGKCQRRTVPLDYPVLNSAVAPQLKEVSPASFRPRFGEIPGKAGATRQPPAVQPALFAYREETKVVPMPGVPASPRAVRTAGTARPRRKVSEQQTAFEFTAPLPAQPFTREIERQKLFAVAPLSLRAAAACIDMLIIAAFSALLGGVAWFLLGSALVWTPELALVAGAGALCVGLCYKLLWCLFCQPTLGLQWAGLRVVGFDGRMPTLSQCVVRILAGWLSLASVGLGLAWALVDAEQLTWHDHVSQSHLTHE